MKYDAIIFDLDGVICSTDKYHFLAWKELANKLNINDYTKEDNNLQRGVSRMESLEVLLKKTNVKYDDNQKKELAEYKNQIYIKLINDLTPDEVSKDCLDTLKKLKKMQIKIAIGSSSKNTKLILQRIGLIDMFDAIVDGNMITHSKPDPEVFLKASEMIGIKPNRCLVVEDAFSGIMSACNGGFDSAGIKDAANSKDATYKINKLSDLLMIIKDK